MDVVKFMVDNEVNDMDNSMDHTKDNDMDDYMEDKDLDDEMDDNNKKNHMNFMESNLFPLRSFLRGSGSFEGSVHIIQLLDSSFPLNLVDVTGGGKHFQQIWPNLDIFVPKTRSSDSFYISEENQFPTWQSTFLATKNFNVNTECIFYMWYKQYEINTCDCDNLETWVQRLGSTNTQNIIQRSWFPAGRLDSNGTSKEMAYMFYNQSFRRAYV